MQGYGSSIVELWCLDHLRISVYYHDITVRHERKKFCVPILHRQTDRQTDRQTRTCTHTDGFTDPIPTTTVCLQSPVCASLQESTSVAVLVN